MLPSPLVSTVTSLVSTVVQPHVIEASKSFKLDTVMASLASCEHCVQIHFGSGSAHK